MRRRRERSRPAIQIAPETLHRLMAAEYAQNYSVQSKRPFRETFAWRTIKWTSFLSILIAASLVVYAAKFVNQDVRQQNDVDRILDNPPKPIPGSGIQVEGPRTPTPIVTMAPATTAAPRTPTPVVAVIPASTAAPRTPSPVVSVIPASTAAPRTPTPVVTMPSASTEAPTTVPAVPVTAPTEPPPAADPVTATSAP